MANIAVVYHSITGTTERLAKAVLAGLETLEYTNTLETVILGSDINEGRYTNLECINALDEVDGIIFGSPTYMGSVSAQFKAFADATGDKWTEQKWAGKVAAGFTIGSNYSGDQLNTIQYLQIFANQHGMIWVSLDIPGGYDEQNRNRLGAQSGLIACTEGSNVHELDLKTAEYLGIRVGNITRELLTGRSKV